LCAHLMMSENHKRRQKTHTKKAQPWLDGNGGKKKDRRSILSSSFIFLLNVAVHSRRQNDLFVIFL
jgi:hypothetical protein